jgi:hypothetical protein
MADIEQAKRAAEARERKRQQWLERVQKEFQVADSWDPNKDPAGLATRLDRMVEMSDKAEVLTAHDKTEVRDRARIMKLRAYEKYLDSLLERTMSAARDKQRVEEKNELLKEVNAVFSIAGRLGTSQAIKDGVKERLDIIRQTSAAGDSSKAKEDAEREALKKEAVFQHEHRTFTRWRDPQISVQIENRTYTTADWSLGGLLIDDIADRNWQPGQQIDIKIGLEPKKLYAERIEVVRYVADTKRLAVKVRRFASVLMQIKRDCDAAGLEPAA